MRAARRQGVLEVVACGTTTSWTLSCTLGGERGREGGGTAEEPALATSLWGMLYAGDVGVVSLSPEQLRTTMDVIVVI